MCIRWFRLHNCDTMHGTKNTKKTLESGFEYNVKYE